jgi:2,3-bisphosphoglycerate-dependent phosphoglycerate mutase
MLELWLIRHGETVWNREGRTQGHSHNPLSTLGVFQAKGLAERLKGVRFDRVYSSDLLRAAATARLAVPKAKTSLDARLREVSGGGLEGRLRTDFTAAEQNAYELAYRDLRAKRHPQGESFEELVARVLSWLEDLPQSGRVVAFCHGGTIRALLYGLGVRDFAELMAQPIPNASITRLRLAGGQAELLELAASLHPLQLSC